jgi:RHS repeat-associated protein
VSRSWRLLLRSVLAVVVLLATPGMPALAQSTSPSQSFTVLAGQAKKQSFDGATLDIGAGAVAAKVTISITSLSRALVPALDLGMANVTRGPRSGYRFLPHGARFQNRVKVSLPYDKQLIPAGMTEQDVKTFYFDDQAGSWQELERVAVDPVAGVVVSLTDHFTDMINATVTVPEHPETLNFNPNSIKDIKAADPGAAISLIAPPGANGAGDARLAYPIEVPPGRAGLQPDLDLTYSSAENNGWLGVGWTIADQAITIDTKWGVPRYDSASETETYTLDGEQLAPVAHRGTPEARTAEKTFHTRVEREFRRIVRHKDGPTSYWWEVTHKNGTRFIYGGDPDANAVDPHATLTDAQGNVFKWALREIRDLHGNGMRYSYAKVTDTGVVNGQVPGYQLYLKSINYTQLDGAAGPYTVTFLRDRELPGYNPQPLGCQDQHPPLVRRCDVVIDARGGFKMVTADLLKRIELTFNGAMVRAYDLEYEEGAFKRTRLKSIKQRGEDGSALQPHAFTYYDDVRPGGTYHGYETPAAWNTGTGDNVSADLLGFGGASALSGHVSESVGGHVYVGFNPSNPLKEGSFGGKVGFTGTTGSETVLALIDINGDHLPDKVFKSGNGVLFRLNQSGPDGTTVFGPAKSIPTLTTMPGEDTFTVSFGAEVYMVGNALINQAVSFTTGSIYFSDTNGDGLTDLVAGGNVLFNHLSADGTPTFGANSADSPVPIGGGQVHTDGLIPDYDSVFQQQLDNAPLHDTLRRWVAPFDGTVQITGNVALVPVPASATTADGVKVSIQRNGDAPLWAATIAAHDTAPKTPSGVGAVQVQRGDRIYFRLQSVFEGAHDRVSWDPEILYVGVPALSDVNLLNPYRYRAGEDFVLAGRRGIDIRVPFNGTVRLTGDLQKLGTTTDDVNLLVLKNGAPVVDETIAWDQTKTLALSRDIAVSQNDALQLRVKVDSPIDLRKLAWTPKLFYVAVSQPAHTIDGQPRNIDHVTDSVGNYLIQLHPPYDVDTYPHDDLSAPQAGWVAPADDTVTVATHLSGAPNLEVSGIVHLTVKKPGALVRKASIPIVAGIPLNTTFNLDVKAGDLLFFDFSAYNPEVKDHLTNKVVTVDGAAVPSAFHSAVRHGVFPGAYRGWAVAGYNGNRDRAQKPINEADLNVVFDKNSSYDPRTAKAYLFTPFPEDRSWRGPEEQTFVKAASMGSSRLGPDFLDVPRAQDFAGGRAVSRQSMAIQTTVGGGISYLSGSATIPGTGLSFGELDYLDMNGDKFPDVVGNGRIQYTTAVGGLEAANRSVAGFGRPRQGSNLAANLGIGGSPADFIPNAEGEVSRSGNGASKENDTGSQMVSLGIGGSLGTGESDVDYDLMDVNGDSLPDRVSLSGAQLMVALNLGYSFAQPEPWGEAVIDDSSNSSLALSASISGFNGGIFDFAGGGSLDKSNTETSRTLADINGDGLLDRIHRDGGNLMVGFNTGNGFLQQSVSWGGAPVSKIAASGNTSLGGGVYFTIGIGPLCLAACYLIVNPGVDGAQAMARQEAMIVDVDGDGYPEYVTSTDDASMSVAHNLTGKTNLLKSVSRPLGASFTIDYARDGNTYDLPQSRWVLARVDLADGFGGDGVDHQVTTFRYENGLYSRLEREFYGYRTVTEEHRDAVHGDALYRSVVREFVNDSFYFKGMLKRQLTRNDAGAPFGETEHTYTLRAVGAGGQLADPQSTTAIAFPELTRVDRRFYEGQAAPGKTTQTTMQYDQNGNVIESFDAGDAGAQDDAKAVITYSSCPSTHVLGIPTSIEVTGNGTLMRKRAAVVDCATADVTRVTQFHENGAASETDLAYFANGNLRSVSGPANHHGQRYQHEYEYDPVVQTHVARVEDSFHFVSTSTYHLKYGRSLTQTDLNGNLTSYTYDAFGRLSTVKGPYEQAGASPTIQFEYHPDASPPWARTRHLDTFRAPLDTIDQVVFVDGLRRVLQTKRDGTVFTAPDTPAQDRVIVSGRVKFDLVGRAAEQYYPAPPEPLGAPGDFNHAYDGQPPTSTAFDVLDRPLTVTFPDGKSTATAYGFGLDRDGVTRLETTTTDANTIQKKTYHDVRDMVVAFKEFNKLPNGPTQEIWTSYTHDPLSRLVQIRDDLNNLTSISYDNLGRQTVLDSPDAGRTELLYDRASNIVAKVTSNLQAQGKRIEYEHDFTRLKSTVYPNFPANNVAYTYGGPGAPANRAGRIVEVTDQAGKEERSYGKLGELVTQTRIVASDTQGVNPEVYTTKFLYDSFGRMQKLTYPDGEVLTYQYDAGGMLRRATGLKGPYTYEYLRRLEYDKFQQRAFQEAGNGVRTQFTYEPAERRLANLKSTRGDGVLFQNLDYGYDDVGNVLSLKNNVPVPPPSQLGGPTDQTFTYDDLYRLTKADGTYKFNPDKTSRYALSMSYDSIHRIKAKTQSHQIEQPSQTPIPQQATTYDWTYAYAGSHPHAPTHIDDRTFGYDGNGNQLGWTNDQDGTRRDIVWDEENRVQSIFDNGHEKTFKYDHAGQRVMKRGPQGETVYVNEFFTIRNREIGTKHVFAGETRVVSKMMKQDKPGANPGGAIPRETDLYFFHPDHLGSTSYVTDPQGLLYEHLEYFPSGEAWVEESTNTQRTPYRFTSKELDEETGLYYSGARYYDPRVGVFISTDPLMQSNPARGLTESHFYNLYHYANNNPLKFVDPDGLDVIIAVGDDKDDPVMRKAITQSANQLKTAIEKADKNVRVVIVSGGQGMAGKLEKAGKDISAKKGGTPQRKGTGVVSSFVYIGHGNSGGVLAPQGYGEAGLNLSTAVEKAGVADKGAAVALACFVGETGPTGLDTTPFKKKSQKVYATGQFVGFAMVGDVASAGMISKSADRSKFANKLSPIAQTELGEKTAKNGADMAVLPAVMAAESRTNPGAAGGGSAPKPAGKGAEVKK